MKTEMAVSSLLLSVLSVGLGGCGAPRVSFTCDSGAPFCDIVSIFEDERPPATGIDITGVAIYQGVEQPLLVDGVASTAVVVPQIAGRDLFVRVLVTRGEGWEDRTITARVYMEQAGVVVSAAQADLEVVADSLWSDLNTTFNVTLPGPSMLEGTLGLRVELVEAAEGVTAGGEEGVNIWPEDDLASLEFESVGDAVRVMVVPVKYNADGSGRLPDTSDEQLEIYRRYLRAYYPTPDVDIRVGSPSLESTSKIVATGMGWTEMLALVADARSQLGASDDEYLYGAFCPTDDFGTFCAGGCVTGLSSVAGTATDVYNRVSIGIGYAGSDSALTLVHELGHAHGRQHSPGCGAEGYYTEYPDKEGYLDYRGYDPLSGTLQETNAVYDFMSYCSPYWTSAFTFIPLSERIREVNQTYRNARQVRVPWRAVWQHSDGSLAWGADRPLPGAPGGELRQVELLGPDGELLGTVGAYFTPFSDLPGGSLVFPDPGFAVSQVRYEGATTPVR